MKTEPLARVWVIYLWTNLVNNKKYVGQSYRLNKRVDEHIKGNPSYKNAKVSPLSIAIYEYGLENFTLEIIHEDIMTQQEANKWEAYYIGYYNTIASNKRGYNIFGSSDTIFIMPPEMCEEQSKKRQGKTNIKNKVGYIGVRKDDRCASFIAHVVKSGKNMCKLFRTEIEAAEAYDKMVLKIYGPEAKLNFPDKREFYLSLDLQKFYDFFLSNENFKNKKTIYKWISPCIKAGKLKWRSRVVDVKLKRIPSLKFSSFDTDVEAAQLADKIAFFYLNASREDLNFPEFYDSYDREKLSIFFSENLYIKTSKYKGVCKKGENRWGWNCRILGKARSGKLFLTEDEAFEDLQDFLTKNFEENEVIRYRPKA